MTEGTVIEHLARRLVIGHKRDGRSIYDAQAKRELVVACLQGKLSMAKVARECGINANVLSNWIRLHERARAEAVPTGTVVDIGAREVPAFVPVQIAAVTDQPAAGAATIDLQVRMPNGIVVDMQGCELRDAGQLIEALGRLRCSASTKG